MSLSSEKIYKRKSSIISVRQQLLQILLRKYIKKVYYGVLAADENITEQPSSTTTTTTTTATSTVKKIKLNDRQLLRHEYYNDIHECLLNYCQLKNLTSVKHLKRNADHKLISQREFIESIKKKRIGSKKVTAKHHHYHQHHHQEQPNQQQQQQQVRTFFLYFDSKFGKQC